MGNIADVADLDVIVAKKEKLTELLESQEACFKEVQGDRYFLDLMIPVIVDIKVISEKALLMHKGIIEPEFLTLQSEIQYLEG